MFLGWPRQCLPPYVGWQFTKGVPYQAPSSLPYFLFSRKLICPFPKVFIADGVRPADLENLFMTAIDEGLDFPDGHLDCPLGFSSIQQQ